VIYRNTGKVILESKKSLVLLGPRQTGKSTLLKSLNPDLVINLSSETEFLNHSSDPGLLSSLIAGKSPRTVFIDEIQRIPALLNTIQAIIDDSLNPPRFYLSGSSARKLKRGEANLLPGRLFFYYMGGLCAGELDYSIDVNKALRTGFLPEPYLNNDSGFTDKLLRDYAAIYLSEEIQAEALTRNISGFSRFLKYTAESAGLVIDSTKLSRKAGVARTSINRFIEILEDTLIAQRIWCFEDTEADTIRHPKLYFFDPGVLNGLLTNFEPSGDRIGGLFEHLVYSQLRNSAMAADAPFEIFYFRTRHGLETDFILKLRGKIYAIECKAGSVTEHDTKSIAAFRDYFPNAEKYFIVNISEEFRVIDGITVCGVSRLMKELGL
jgi:uncharacterized protein